VNSTSDEVLGHLSSCCDAVYRALGESAPVLGNDAFVVRTHEMSRAFGELAAALRTPLVSDEPLAVIESVLDDAAANDATGAMLVYAMVIAVGPRLLVSLRDARIALAGDPAADQLIDHVAEVAVREIRQCAEVARDLGIGEDEDEDEGAAWRAAARRLTEALENSGNGESFGISR
jgi:hypothetical protein